MGEGCCQTNKTEVNPGREHVCLCVFIYTYTFLQSQFFFLNRPVRCSGLSQFGEDEYFLTLFILNLLNIVLIVLCRVGVSPINIWWYLLLLFKDIMNVFGFLFYFWLLFLFYIIGKLNEKEENEKCMKLNIIYINVYNILYL